MSVLKARPQRTNDHPLDTQTAALLDARPARKVDQPPVSSGLLLALTGAGLIGASAIGLAFGHRNGARPSHAARFAASGAALLAASVLADSAMEHFRGNYKKPAMFVAPTAAAATLATAVATVLTIRFASLKAMVFGGAVHHGTFRHRISYQEHPVAARRPVLQQSVLSRSVRRARRAGTGRRCRNGSVGCGAGAPARSDLPRQSSASRRTGARLADCRGLVRSDGGGPACSISAGPSTTSSCMRPSSPFR